MPGDCACVVDEQFHLAPAAPTRLGAQAAGKPAHGLIVCYVQLQALAGARQPPLRKLLLRLLAQAPSAQRTTWRGWPQLRSKTALVRLHTCTWLSLCKTET